MGRNRPEPESRKRLIPPPASAHYIQFVTPDFPRVVNANIDVYVDPVTPPTIKIDLLQRCRPDVIGDIGIIKRVNDIVGSQPRMSLFQRSRLGKELIGCFGPKFKSLCDLLIWDATGQSQHNQYEPDS